MSSHEYKEKIIINTENEANEFKNRIKKESLTKGESWSTKKRPCLLSR